MNKKIQLRREVTEKEQSILQYDELMLNSSRWTYYNVFIRNLKILYQHVLVNTRYNGSSLRTEIAHDDLTRTNLSLLF